MSEKYILGTGDDWQGSVGVLLLGAGGFGVLAETVPSGGVNGPGYIYDYLVLPGVNTGKEVCGKITTFPANGTLVASDNSAFIYTPNGPGTDYFIYQGYVDGVAYGSPQTVPLNSGVNPVAGAAAAIATASGQLSQPGSGISGAASDISTAAGSLSTAIPLAGAAAALSSAAGQLNQINGAISGAAVDISTAAGSLSTAIPLAGAATARVAASGSLSGFATTTIREQILTQLLALLYNATDCLKNVYRVRVEPFTRDDLPAINIRPKQETAQSLAIDIMSRVLIVEIEIHVRGTAPDQLAETIIRQAHALLTRDQTLGGLVARIIEHETSWEFADADNSASKLTATYEIKYHTKARDLTTY